MIKPVIITTCAVIALNLFTFKANNVPMSIEEMAEHCELSVEDFELFAGVVEAESNRQTPADGELTTEGREMIALVIWNRTYSEQFPDDPRSVLCQRGQFSTVSGGVSCTQPTSYSRQAVVNAYDTIHSGEEYPEVLFFNCIWFFSGRTPYPNPDGSNTFGGNYFSL